MDNTNPVAQATNPNVESILGMMIPAFNATETVGNVVKALQKSAVVVELLKAGTYQKSGTITAVLRQRVLIAATYPSISIDNNMQNNPFSMDEFGLGAGETHNSRENRVAFIDVPSRSTIEQVTAKIAQDAQLYKILSSTPILTNNHLNAIERGLTSKDEIAKSQVARYPQGDANQGQVIPDKANNKPVQYRKVFFWNGRKADEDLRGGDAYVPESIQQELTGDTGVTIQPEMPVNQSQLV